MTKKFGSDLSLPASNSPAFHTGSSASPSLAHPQFPGTSSDTLPPYRLLRHSGFLTSPHAFPACNKRSFTSLRLLLSFTNHPSVAWAHLLAAHETSGGKVMGVWIAQSVCSCSRMRNSWQSRPRHVQQCVPHNQPTPCMRCSIRSTQSAAGSACATVWIATSFRPLPCVFVHTLACLCS